MSNRSSERNIQRLVEKVRQKADGRMKVRVRTLLSAFGYSRRSPENVRAITQRLAEEGVTVEFSVTSPPTVDERIELVGQVRSGSEVSRPVPAADLPAASPAMENVPVAAPAAAVVDVAQPESGLTVLPNDVLTDPAVLESVELTTSGPEGEPPRSFAARLFRAALGLFRREPPASLRTADPPLSEAPPPPSAGAPPPAVAATRTQDSVRNAAPGPPPPAPDAAPAPSQPAAVVNPTASAVARELSCVAEQTIAATVFVQVEEGHGSGFIVHPDGLVVTACHVLDGPNGLAKKATIRLNDGRETTASLVRAHRPLDYALLWLDKPGQYPVLTVGDASRTRYAETVLAVGHPGVGRRALTNTVSTGVVANPACSERGIDWIQMTTDIDQGNSGGPLVNRSGEVIGVNCWKFTAVAAAKMALPIDYLDEDLAAATERGRGGYADGQVCPICGWFEADLNQWFCRTCGAAYPADDAVA